MTYNKKELIERLEKGEDLREDEYRALILNSRLLANDHLLMIKSPLCKNLLMKYAVYGAAATKLGRDGADLVRGCAYMIGTFSTNLNHYESLVKYADPCLTHMSRFNTLNYIHQAQATDAYDLGIGDLHDSLAFVFNQGITDQGMFDVQESIDNLEKEKSKIMTIKKKYIGFTL